MPLSDGARRELERVAASGATEFGDRGFVRALERFGTPDTADRALLERAAVKVDEKAGA